MIRSMTGFGEASSQVGGVHYFLELRSLNNKYFKAAIRLPDEFQGLEAELEAELRRRLTRGSVFLTATCSDASADAAYEINERALSRYVEQLRRSPEVAGGDIKIELSALLNLPGVLQPPANEEERLDRAREAFLPLLDVACKHLVAMREREGVCLADDLRAQRGFIAERLKIIAERAPQIVADYERRLSSRIQTMLREAGLAVEPVDVIREIAIWAERSDIAEEISRLGAHIDQFEELLSRPGGGPGPVGRTLDFLAQEMLREANTIASKCADAQVSRTIVEVKGAIDRIKEQIQNVE